MLCSAFGIGNVINGETSYAVLKEHADDPTTGAELYVHLIAVEIVSHTTEQQLQTIE